MDVTVTISDRWKDLSGGETDRRRRKAWRAGLRDAGRGMRTQATRHVRDRRVLRARTVRDRLRLRVTRSSAEIVASGAPIPLVEYPHRQTNKGVSVRVDRGTAKIIPSAFVARMRQGHVGIYRRLGKSRLPIKQLYGPTVADVIRDTGVPDRLLAEALEKFRATYERVLALGEK